MRPAIALSSIALASCSPSTPADPQLEIGSAWARPALHGGQASAAYLTIRNNGAGEDRLVGARSDHAGKVTIHSSSLEGGIARMRPVESVEIAARSIVKLEPGGYHLMLEKLTQPLAPGSSVRIALRFERSGDQIVDAQVRSHSDDLPHEGH